MMKHPKAQHKANRREKHKNGLWLYAWLMLCMWLCNICPIQAQVAPAAQPSAPNAYQRHFVLLVDQTVSLYPQLDYVYIALNDWLKGKTPTHVNTAETSVQNIPAFDPQHDQLTVVAFALPGTLKHAGTNAFKTIHSMALNGADKDAVYNKMLDCLISPRTDFRSSGTDFDLFMKHKVYPLFGSNDPLKQLIRQHSGITLSYYIYPLVFERISAEVPAQQFIVITVSDFKSGAFNQNGSADHNVLNSLMAGRATYVNYVEQHVNEIKNPYTEVELAHIVAGTNAQRVVAKATALAVKQSILHSPLFLVSNVNVDQSKGSVFSISPATISFNKDESVRLDKIELVVSRGNEVLAQQVIDSTDYAYDDATREYHIDKQKIDLGTTSLGGDNLTVSYNLYTHAHVDGADLLPFMYSAQRDINANDITYINQTLRRNMTIAILVIILLGVVFTLLYRGRNKRVEVTIGRFAQKFTNITSEHGATEFPCWFYSDGADATRSIKIEGEIYNAKSFAVGVKTKLYVRLQNLLPQEGITYYINNRQVGSDWARIEKTGARQFSFILKMVIDTNKISPAELTTCHADLDFKVDSDVFGTWRHIDVDHDNSLDFYFTQNLGTAWVGFDPGTTGSCVAFGNTGGTLDDPAILMATGAASKEIIPSCLGLNKNFGNKPLEELIPGKDYSYGGDADTNEEAMVNDHTPVFRSIKKLLGYENDIEAQVGKSSGGGHTTRHFKGKDLAYLLVKGLQKDLENNIRSLKPSDLTRYVGNNGFAQRAVVAIPNNYTLPKILDMVDSIRRFDNYHEVRFIYEAEAVLFNYLSRNYSYQKPGTETVMVYDMGGATINLSVFRVTYTQRGGSLYYHVETLGRIGYNVGGDNIDVALMEHLLTQDVKGWSNEQQRRDYELDHKVELLKQMLAIKKDLISFEKEGHAHPYSKFLNEVSFANFVGQLLQDTTVRYVSPYSDTIPYFGRGAYAKVLDSEELEKFVYANIDDVMNEILDYPDVKGQAIDTLIFSGRSSLFPKVRDHVQGRLGKVSTFDLNDEQVKTAVAYGACWYGIYNSLITLDNSRLASAYGFKLTANGKANLNVLLEQNERFTDSGALSAMMTDVDDSFDADGNQINFYQVMGSGHSDNIFAEENRHKVNFIGTITATTLVQTVEMSVTRNNMVNCRVMFDTGEEKGISDIQVQGRDITKENDWPYVFATTTPANKAEASVYMERTHHAHSRKGNPAQPATPYVQPSKDTNSNRSSRM